MKRSVLGMILARIMVASATGYGGSAAKDGKQAKNVKIQVPAKADGGTDMMARTLANKASAESGSTITIVNSTNGGGVITYEKAATRKRDGSILIQRHLTVLIKVAAGLYDKSATEGFTVVGVAVPKGKVSSVLVVFGGSSYRTLDDSIGTTGERLGEVMLGVKAGGTVHIQTGPFAKAAGVDIKYVEAGFNTKKLITLMGSSIGTRFVDANQVKQYVESDKTRALGIISNSDEGGHDSMPPEMPDFVEQGMGFSLKILNVVLVGPRDMDSELISGIYDCYTSAANDTEVVKTLVPAGMEVEFLSLEEGGSTSEGVQGQIGAVMGELGLRE